MGFLSGFLFWWLFLFILDSGLDPETQQNPSPKSFLAQGAEPILRGWV